MKQNKWLSSLIISIGTITVAINSSIVTIANPILATEFGVSMSQVQWITTIYFIVSSSLMLLFGRLGVRFGAHRIYIFGIALFTFGTLLCAISDSFLMLLFSRIIQGTGGAMATAVAIGLIATIFPAEQRGRALGINVLMVGFGNVAGPVVGGMILAVASWHYVFLLSLPFGCITFIMAALWLRSPLPKKPNVSLDLPGTFFLTLVVTSFIVFLSGSFAGQEWFGLLFIGALIGFIAIEKKAKSPLIVLEVLADKRFLLGNLVAFCSYSAYMGLQFQLPFFLDTVWSVHVGTSGLLLMIGAFCMAVSGFVSGFLSDRFGALKVMPIALAIFITCIVLAFFLGVEVSLLLFALIVAFGGLGMGLLNTPNNSEIVTAAGTENSAFASSFVSTGRQLAFSFGTALSASVFSLATNLRLNVPFVTEHFGGTVALDHLFSFKAVLVVCLVLAIASLILCLAIKYGKQR